MSSPGRPTISRASSRFVQRVNPVVRVLPVFALALFLSFADASAERPAAAAQPERPPAPSTSQHPPNTADHLPDVLLSRQLLDAAGVGIGDIVTLAADEAGTRSTRFRVAGAYEPTPDPARFNVKRFEARLHLTDLE